jgi:hypothetical protein
MTDYYVDYTAFVDERKRPENFPKQVHVVRILNSIQGTDHLKHEVNQVFLELVTSAGLVAMKDPNEIVEQGMVTFDKRFFVPWHMLTHMQVDVKVLVRPEAVIPQSPIVPTEPEIKPEEKVN